MILLLAACSPANLLPAPTTPASLEAGAAASVAPARVYAAIVSHNEEPPHPECTPIMNESGSYVRNRAVVVEMAQAVVAHQAAWNLQSDWAWAEAARQWDSPEIQAASGGKNIIQYLATLDPSRVVVDAHAHATSYNQADVSSLLAAMGAPPNGVLGGLIYQPPGQEDWTKFRSEQVGARRPTARWRAEILWGAGTKMHLSGDLQASGIWRPKDAEHFTEDDPSQSLVYVGAYTNAFTGIRELLDRLHRGELQAGHMYTITVSVHQCSLTSAEIAKVMAEVDAFAPDVAAGDLVWAPIQKMVEVWRRDYHSTPTVLMPIHDMSPGAARSAGPPGGPQRGGPPGGGPRGGPPGGGPPGGGPRGGGPPGGGPRGGP